MSSLDHFAYWGKAGKGPDAARFHLLPYHSLDVAAVGHVLLQRHHGLRRLLAGRAALDPATFAAWHAWFLALHDLGKFSYRFQAVRPDLYDHLQHAVTDDRYTQRHDSLGWLLWSDGLGAEAIAAALGRPLGDALDHWARAVLGHHGQPPKELAMHRVAVDDHFSDDNLAAARGFIAECTTLLLADAGPLPDGRTLGRALAPLSWWLAGLAVLCDWLGSGRPADTYQTRAMPLARYWRDHALPHAEALLERVGLLPLPSTPHTLEELFDVLRRHEPAPLQRHAADRPLGEGPQLYILEDVTGAGKTEAALMLAHRLIAAGRADGLYFGLPTMATSNAIYRRIRADGLPAKLFDGEPSLILAHSASRLEQAQRRDPLPPPAAPETDYAGDERAAAAERGTWLHDNRKKALLADLGVGTIDQVLLAVLHSRHQALRLLGLVRKVLIVDEVHAYDSYMQQLLAGVLTFQAAIGADVILLSATLPRAMRQDLADAYTRGLGTPPPALADDAYPLLTRIGADGKEEHRLATRPQVVRTVGVELLHDTAAVLEQLRAVRQRGQCACWIRNTVAEAVEAWQALRDQGIPADLFHARFTLQDRLAREERVMAQFGPDSGEAQRRGRILIATQVVEQSLDLDFDLLVTDLAPIDLIIQRTGRLRRHPRDARGNRAERDERGPAVLHLHTPEPVAEPTAGWFSDFSPGAARVYKDYGRLWLTACLLRQTSAITMPGDARTLIDGVYGQAAQERIPDGLRRSAATATGVAMAERAVGRGNSVPLHAGYQTVGLNFWDDTRTPTRLGDPTTTVRLARWDGARLTPWHALERFAWELSQVGVRQSLVKGAVEPDDPALRRAIEEYTATVFDQGRWSVLVVMRQQANGGWSGGALNGKGERVRVRYDGEVGLQAEAAT